MTEGSEADNHLTVEVIYGKLGQEVVAFIDTYDDSAKGICLVLILLYCMSCFIIESVDSISRDGPDTPIYIIH